MPAVVFKKEDYMIKLATRWKHTVVGKFSNAMPRMEVIRRSFITQTELKGGVKIAHLYANTVNIDLDNEYDHATVWNKQFMYIQGQMMKLEVWTPLFKPNEASPIVPAWIVILELPWHFYYMEILTPLLSHVGKALFLDLASFQKTRESVAKVKMQIDLTKDRPHHVWLGYDDNQNEMGMNNNQNSEGQKSQQNIQSKDNAQNRTEPKTLEANPSQEEWQTQKNKKSKGGAHNNKQHAVYIAKQPTNQQHQIIPKENHQQDPQSSGMASINPPAPLERSAYSGAYNQPISPASPIIYAVEVIGGKKICQEETVDNREGVPNRGGIPHFFHECDDAQMTDHRIDHTLATPATTISNPAHDTAIPVSSEEDIEQQWIR
ncbi:hypothetical protein A4A49_24576 [Nicotiana attenuata]|uniref:DUF4283 domain-containing protein n=1 Tax=Nicotiana attenuata TaxID=49451 RepID=A0A314KV91_NICAT|nr:hypothetical protein A4A49_24576 [Nicotiana attenuata]